MGHKNSRPETCKCWELLVLRVYITGNICNAEDKEEECRTKNGVEQGEQVMGETMRNE